MNDIFFFGASGHAKVLLDIVEKEGKFRIVAIFDDNSTLKGQTLLGYPILGGRKELFEAKETFLLTPGIISIGENSTRRQLFCRLREEGFRWVSIIHPSAILGRGVKIGEGTAIMPGTTINVDTSIGSNVIINTGSNIDHDCIVGDDTHIAPGSTLCGSVVVGCGCLIGVGAKVLPNLKIGDHVIVGANATVIEDIPDGVTVIGTPARGIQKGENS